MAQDDDPLWQRYELSIHKLISAYDSTSRVLHNQRVTGWMSLTPRQVDVWVEGEIGGMEISVAVECKRRNRPLQVGTVDEFVGKLLDLGADRGAIYSYSGFTDSAVQRAIAASNPRILTIALETPEVVLNLRGVPGYPADLLVQECPPQWIEELSTENFERMAAWMGPSTVMGKARASQRGSPASEATSSMWPWEAAAADRLWERPTPSACAIRSRPKTSTPASPPSELAGRATGDVVTEFDFLFADRIDTIAAQHGVESTIK